MSYASKDDIKDIIGAADTSGIRDAFLKIADIYIDTHIANGDFLEHKDEITLVDIERDDTSEIMLKYPILKVTRVTDNLIGSSPSTLLSNNYDFKADAGILYLIQSNEVGTSDEQSTYFTKGNQNVSVIYDYGYESVPDDIHTFANEFAAKICQSDIELAEVGAMVSEKIGNYSYQVNIGKNIMSRYPYLQILEESLIKKYKKIFV